MAPGRDWFFILSSLVIVGALALAMVLVGYMNVGTDNIPTPGMTAPPVGDKAKTLTISGSTSVLPLAQSEAKAFMKAHPNYSIRVIGDESLTGIQDVAKKTVDIGMSSVELSAKDLSESPYAFWKIAQDGIAIIVNTTNPVETLTLDQVRAIYQGEVTNWNQVGGPDMQIVPIGRDPFSGTRKYFSSHVMDGREFSPRVSKKNSNEAVVRAIGQTSGGIGYISMGYLNPSVASLRYVPGAISPEGVAVGYYDPTQKIKALRLDTGNHPVDPTSENVKNGSYPLSRDLFFVTNGMPDEEARAFIDFVLSPEGQAIAELNQYVPLTSG